MAKELTEQQKRFLEALFGEAQGSPAEAKKLAGYADSTKTIEILRGLKEEILEHASLTLATHSPKATMELVGLLVDPIQSGAQTKLKVIQEILNRTGITGPDKNQEVKLNIPQGGIFIMPAKESASINKEIDNEGNES